jgi:CBS domain-containing protein
MEYEKVCNLPSATSLVYVEPTILFSKAFEILVNKNVLSVPVIKNFDDETQDLVGLLDVIDICKYVLLVSKSLKSHSTDEEVKEMQRRIQNASVRQIREGIRGSVCIPIPESANISELYPLLAEYELHRVPVIDNNGKVDRIISQSDLVKHFERTIDTQTSSKTLLQLKFTEKPVKSVTTENTVYDAFRTIVQERISAVAVVDLSGKLVGNISASDIRSIGFTADSLKRLLWSVGKFLENKQVEYQSPKEVVCVKPTSKLSEVLQLLNSRGLHRVYLVNDAQIPTGIIALTDILKLAISLEPAK